MEVSARYATQKSRTVPDEKKLKCPLKLKILGRGEHNKKHSLRASSSSTTVTYMPYMLRGRGFTS